MNKFEKAKQAAIADLDKHIKRLAALGSNYAGTLDWYNKKVEKVKALNEFPVNSAQLDAVGVTAKAKILKAHLEQELPAIKFSVKSHRFAGGSALEVYFVTPKEQLNREISDKAQKIVALYSNDHGSDPMTDYFAVDNYAHVENVPYWDAEVVEAQ